MTSHMEAARDAAEYDECEHGVPTCNDCVDCMKRAHADEIRALNDENEAQAKEIAALQRLKEENARLRAAADAVMRNFGGGAIVIDFARKDRLVVCVPSRHDPDAEVAALLTAMGVLASMGLKVDNPRPHADALGNAGGDGGGR